MQNKRTLLKIGALLVAATVGDGIFALPYVFYKVGWFVGLAYLVVLAAVVITAHIVYLKTLERLRERERLIGLTKKYFGNVGFGIAFFAVIGGLLFALIAILVLGARFITLLFPGLPISSALFAFWALVSLPLFLEDASLLSLEFLGVVCTSAIIILVFISAWPGVNFGGAPAVNSSDLFLPFGVILFALAGWPGVEPAYEVAKKGKVRGKSFAVAAGTIFAALLYILFVTGILGSAGAITSDTLSGLFNWPLWERTMVAILGLLAVWTVYMPISREIKNGLAGDLKWNILATKLVIILTPLLFVLAGFNNFLSVVGFVGGVFLSLQYVLMIAVGRRALDLALWKKIALDLISLVFVLAAVYEVYYFIVR